MAITISFTFTNDTKALAVFNEICDYNDYEQNKLNGESKKNFIKRITKNWWLTSAMQGKIRANKKTWLEEFEALEIT